MKKLLFILPALTIWHIAAQRFTAEIAPFAQDKRAAVSISFDDGSYGQFKYAFPLLEKYGIKATFSAVGEWTRDSVSPSAEPGMFTINKMGWNELRTLARAGHEIAAHGFRHRKYLRNGTVKSIADDMRKAKFLIEQHIRRPVVTLHYPYSFTSDSIIKAARTAGFLFGRTGSGTGDNFNSYEGFNPYLLRSIAFLNDTLPGIDSLRTILRAAEGKWVILMYHHLFTPRSKPVHIMRHHGVNHTYTVFPSKFERHLRLLQQFDYWIAPEEAVGKYMYERLHTRLKTRRRCGRYKIRTVSSFDTDQYDEPLWLIVKLPWKKVKIKGSLRDGILTLNGSLKIPVRPGSTIIIRKMKE